MHALSLPRRSLGVLAVLSMVLTFTVGIQTPAFAATFEVDKVEDTDDDVPGDGDCDDGTGTLPTDAVCSLRAAVQEANALAGADMITFATGIDPVLTQDGDDDDAADGDLDVVEALTIQANADTVISSTMTAPERILHALAPLTITNGTLTGGDVDDGNAAADVNDGGALLVAAATELTGVTFDANSAGRAGGAIEVDGGTLDTTDVTFTDNTAGVNGGAVHVSNGDTTFTDVTVTANRADGEGGGLWNGAGATMTVDTDDGDSTFTDNTASGDDATQGGGSLFNIGGTLNVSDITSTGGIADGTSGSGGAILSDGGVLNVTDSSLDSGSANRAGGGIEAANGATVTVTGTDFDGNTAGDNPGNGGAIHLSGTSTADITDGAVTNNTAASEGGGFWNSTATMTVTGTTFVGNVANGETSDTGGGALFNNGGTLDLAGLTVRDNDALQGAGSGGGLLSVGGDVTVDGGLFDDNDACRAGGGIELQGGTLALGVGEDAGVDFDSNDTGATNGGGCLGGAPGNGAALHVTAGDVTAEGGDVTGNIADAEGGGFWNAGGSTMTVTDTRFTDNSAGGDASDQGGGSLFNDGGTLVVDGVTSMGGDATGDAGSGGGLLSVGGTLDVDGSTFANGTASRAGGGIEIVNTHDAITIDDTDFRGNSVGINGGGIHVTGDPGATVAITGGRTTGNNADQEGGGFWNATGTMTVDGTFLAGNTAQGDDASQGGGGLFNIGGTLRVTNAEVTNNSATGTSGSGGGILSDGGVLDVADSIIDDNDANRAGGGIEGRDDAAVTVSGTDLTDNAAGSNPGNGGAVHLSQSATLSITGGEVTGNTAASEGGGLWNSTATMEVDGTTISGNTASGDAADNGGGGVFNNGGTLTVTDATITGNSADGASGSGGGIQAVDGGAVTVTGSTIEDNDANRAGGGVETNGPVTATITTSTLSGNATGDSPGNGGGLHITGGGDVDLDRSTVVGNSATNEGGGIWNSGVGTLTVTNSTITGNSTDGDGSQAFSVGSDTTLSFTTLADFGDDCGSATSDDSDDDSGDSTCTDGAAAVDTADGGSITLDNSIVATGGDDACNGTTDSAGGNVVTDDTCDLDGPGDQASADAALEALADNGGPTRTHALGDDSAALSAAVGDCPDTDQRGVDRDSDECDSGAFEGGVPIPPDDEAPDTTITDDPGRGSISSTVRFGFDSDDDSARFECRITGATTLPFADCASPQSYNLGDGDYRFTVRAKDAAGNVDASPAFHEFTIDTQDTFDDDDDSNFETDIEKLHAAGITKGCNPPDNDEFCPDRSLTRGEMAALLTRAFELPPGTETFTDVDSDDTFAADIGAIQRAGITKGCNPPDNDEFCPDLLVPREEMAAFMRRALNLAGGTEDFIDVAADNKFRADIGAIAREGITKGCNPPSNNRFCPDRDITRGEVAAFFVRAGLT